MSETSDDQAHSQKQPTARLPSRKSIVIALEDSESGQPSSSNHAHSYLNEHRRNTSFHSSDGRNSTSDNLHHFYFNRSQLNEKKLLEKYSFKNYNSNDLMPNIKNYLKKYYKPSPSCMKRYIFKRFPILDWLVSIITSFDQNNLFSNEFFYLKYLFISAFV